MTKHLPLFRLSNLRNLLALSLLAGIACFFLSTASSSAATIDVAAGNDETVANSNCSLSEAITNINNGDATTYPECTGTGAFGTDDTINLPDGTNNILDGTIILTADLPVITKSVTIQGAGMGQTIIDGDGAWQGLDVALGSGDFTLTGITITAFDSGGIRVQGAEATTISQVEIDGNNVTSSAGSLQAFGVNNDTPYATTVDLSDMYIHDFDVDASGILQVLLVSTSSQSDMNVVATRITIAHIRNTGAVQTALFGPVTGTVNGDSLFTADVSNITVHDITSTTSMAMGIVIVNIGNIDVIPVLNVTNATIDSVTSSSGLPLNIPLLGAAAGAENANETAQSALNVSNVLISGAEGSTANCGVLDIGPFTGGAGTGTGTITSTGGNLSDDTSCEPYFDHASDQNNVAALAASLSPLADNGGYVPTMALMETSPAVDSGITVSGLSTDARGQARPQGLAYDSGAYESPFTRTTAPTPTDDGQGLAESGEGLVTTLASVGALVGAAFFLRKRFSTGYKLN